MKIKNTKRGQNAEKKQVPWFVCIYHKYVLQGGEYFERLAFEPKAYNEDDKLLADSSFGFKFSELSYMICPDGILEVYDKHMSKKDINTAYFYDVIMDEYGRTSSFEVDFIECEDQSLFEALQNTQGFFVQDIFKDHSQDRKYSSMCVSYGLKSQIPLYDKEYRWDNGLIGQKRG